MKMNRFSLLLSMSVFAFGQVQGQQQNDSKSLPFLGVETDECASLEEGVLIDGIYKGYAAAEAGLQRGDILLAINGDDVNSLRELKLELKPYKAGDEIELTFMRFNKEMKAKAKLSESPKYMDRMASEARCEADGKSARSKKAFMGIHPTTDWAAGGVRIESFTDKSQAWRAGLEEGDVITKLDGHDISTTQMLTNYLLEKKPGQEMKVDFLRNGKEKSLFMTLGETRAGGPIIDERELRELSIDMEELGERIGEKGEALGRRIEREVRILADEVEEGVQRRKGRREAGPSNEERFSLSEFTASPNPTTGNLTVSFAGRSNMAFAVCVTDEDGKEILREDREALEEGVFTHQFDLTNQPAGIYFVRVWKGEDVITSARIEKK